MLVRQSTRREHAGDLLGVERAEVDAQRADDGRQIGGLVGTAGHCTISVAYVASTH